MPDLDDPKPSVKKAACRNCGKEIYFNDAVRRWYHTYNYSIRCHHEEAEPEEAENGTET